MLEGQISRIDKNMALEEGSLGPLLETQVVDVADSITYDAHDTDDAVKLGLLTLDELCEVELGKNCLHRIQQFATRDIYGSA